MAIHPGMAEPLAERTRDLYAAAELRLLGIIARQLADGFDAPGWAERKLTAVTALRRSAQGIDELGKAVRLDVFDAIAEAYNTGHRAAVAELGALPDRARQMVDEITPHAQAVDRLAQETVDVVTSTHRSTLRTIVDTFRAIAAEVTTDGALALLVQRHDQSDETQKEHARRLDTHDARLDTFERGETERQKRGDARLDALDRARWPLPSVAALVALCGLLLSLRQLTSR